MYKIKAFITFLDKHPKASLWAFFCSLLILNLIGMLFIRPQYMDIVNKVFIKYPELSVNEKLEIARSVERRFTVITIFGGFAFEAIAYFLLLLWRFRKDEDENFFEAWKKYKEEKAAKECPEAVDR